MNQVFPHKIKNPVLDRSISTVEKDCIHESVSVIDGSGSGLIHRGYYYLNIFVALLIRKAINAVTVIVAVIN